MTREEAQERIRETPEFIPGACPWCGATTFEEANTKCRPQSLPSGEYYCGSPDAGPNCENATGPLYQRTPEYDALDGYLLGGHVFDEGLTKRRPVWAGN